MSCFRLRSRQATPLKHSVARLKRSAKHLARSSAKGGDAAGARRWLVERGQFARWRRISSPPYYPRKPLILRALRRATRHFPGFYPGLRTPSGSDWRKAVPLRDLRHCGRRRQERHSRLPLKLRPRLATRVKRVVRVDRQAVVPYVGTIAVRVVCPLVATPTPGAAHAAAQPHRRRKKPVVSVGPTSESRQSARQGFGARRLS